MKSKMKQFVLVLALSNVYNVNGFTSLPTTPATATTSFTNPLNQKQQHFTSPSKTELSVSLFSSDVLVPFALLYGGWLLVVDISKRNKKGFLKKPKYLSGAKATVSPLLSSTAKKTTTALAATSTLVEPEIKSNDTTVTIVDNEKVEDESNHVVGNNNSASYHSHNMNALFLQNLYATTTNLPVAEEVSKVVEAEEILGNEEAVVTEAGISEEARVRKEVEEVMKEVIASVKKARAEKEKAKEQAMKEETLVQEPVVEEEVVASIEEDQVVLEEGASTIDVSIPYDAAARLSYDEWRAKFGKGDFDETKYETFKQNYEMVAVANVKAARDRQNGKDASIIELNESADTKAISAEPQAISVEPQDASTVEPNEYDDTKAISAESHHVAAKSASTTKKGRFLASLFKAISPAPSSIPAPVPQATIDVSIPYDAAARLAYDEWRVQYGKGDFEAQKYETFKQNYEVVAVANVKAAKDCKEGKDVATFELGELADTIAISIEPKAASKIASTEPASEFIIDVSVPYDAAARLAYEEWRVQYGKGDFDDLKYETFKQNYEVVAVANVKAAKALLEGKDATTMELNEFADTEVISVEPKAVVEVSFEKGPSPVPESTIIDVSIPYDAATRFAYDEWRVQYGKGDFDAEKYETFKQNYEKIAIRIVKAARDRKQGKDVATIELNEFADTKAIIAEPEAIAAEPEVITAGPEVITAGPEAKAVQSTSTKTRPGIFARFFDLTSMTDEEVLARQEEVKKRKEILAKLRAEETKAIEDERKKRQASQEKAAEEARLEAEAAAIAAAKEVAEKEALQVATRRENDLRAAEMERQKAAKSEPKHAELKEKEQAAIAIEETQVIEKEDEAVEENVKVPELLAEVAVQTVIEEKEQAEALAEEEVVAATAIEEKEEVEAAIEEKVEVVAAIEEKEEVVVAIREQEVKQEEEAVESSLKAQEPLAEEDVVVSIEEVQAVEEVKAQEPAADEVVASSNVIATNNEIKFFDGGKKRRMIKSFLTSKWNAKVVESTTDEDHDADMTMKEEEEELKQGDQPSMKKEENDHPASAFDIVTPTLLSSSASMSSAATTVDEKDTVSTKEYKSNIKTFSQESSEKQSATTTLSRLLNMKSKIKNKSEHPASVTAESVTEVLTKEPTSSETKDDQEVVTTNTKTVEKPKAEVFVPKKMNWKRETPFVIVYTKDNPIDVNDYIKSKAKSTPPLKATDMASEKNKAEIGNIDEKNTEENENNNLKQDKLSAVVITSPIVTRKRDKFRNMIQQLNRRGKRVATTLSVMMCLYISSSHTSSSSSRNTIINNGKQFIAVTSESIKDLAPVLDKTSSTTTNGNKFTTVAEKQIQLSPLHKKRILSMQQQDKERRSVYAGTTTNDRKQELEGLLKVESTNNNVDEISVAGQFPVYLSEKLNEISS